MKYYTTSVRRSELSQERKEYIARRIELEKQEEIANMRRQLDSSDNPDPELAAKLAEYTKPPKKKQRRKHQFY
jgi:spore germination cell wall hydrolase CwlJ-like protein